MLIQQGDVLLKKVEQEIISSRLDKFTKAKDCKHVIAEGEQTGHAHVAFGNNLLVASLAEGKMLASLEEPFCVKHEEHNEVIVPAGVWLIEKVKEYDHFAEGTREVRD
jgi:hypothetical protein